MGRSSAVLSTPFLTFAATAALLILTRSVQAQTFYVSIDNTSTGNSAIDRVSSTGAVSLFATLPTNSQPQGLAFDTSGNLYVAEANASLISKITPGGGISTFATGITTPTGLVFDTSGNLYVANAGAPSSGTNVNKITPGGVVTLFATLAGSFNPVGLAYDGSGNLYAAGNNGGSNFQVDKITPGGSVSSFASSLPGRPIGLAFDGSGNLYVTDSSSNQISKITSGGAVSTFANLPASSGPNGLAFDSSGNLYAANNTSGNITMLTSGATQSTFATGLDTPVFIALAPTPEPGSAALALLGGLGLLARRRRNAAR